MSNIQVLYDNFELIPAPLISINKEFIYANDSIIGFTYIINIQGYASSVNYSTNTTSSNLVNTINAIDVAHAILHKNGKNLEIRCNGNTIFFAVGGQLRSFNVDEGDNKWTQFTKYSASLEFNTAQYTNDQTSEIALDSLPGDFTNYLIRLKNYNDSWNFKTSEEEIYAHYMLPNGAGEDFTRFNVEYTISATGKHYYDVNGNLVPSWIAAKNFVQQKLYHQILTFRNASPLSFYFLPNSSYDSNESSAPNLNQSLSSTFTGATVFPLLSSDLGAAPYLIFNETINCSSSESDGTFTATYSCICKRITSWMPHSIHTFDVNYDKTRDFKETNNTITVNGTVTGMVATNIIADIVDGSVLMLPNNGPFISSSMNDFGNKYFNALNDFNTYIANASHTDLQPIYKTILGATYGTLFSLTNTSSCINLSNLVEPQSFNINHNYSNHSVDYSVEYNTRRACALERGFETLTITEEDSVPIIAEFIIPGRQKGPILQHLNTNSNKKISIEYKGVTKKGCVVGTPFSVDFQGQGLQETDEYVNLPPKVLESFAQTEAFAEEQGSELITESYNVDYSPVTGDYTISKKYMVCPPPMENN